MSLLSSVNIFKRSSLSESCAWQIPKYIFARHFALYREMTSATSTRIVNRVVASLVQSQRCCGHPARALVKTPATASRKSHLFGSQNIRLLDPILKAIKVGQLKESIICSKKIGGNRKREAAVLTFIPSP